MKPYVIAVTGASAQPFAEKTLELLLSKDKEVNLILSKGAYQVWLSEMKIKIPIDPLQQESFWRERLNINTGKLKCYKWNDNSANIASGSYKTTGMVIIPASMGTIGRIASGVSLDLIERVADVHLKESKPLILVPRETPLNLIHLRNLTSLAEAGAKVVPPMPAWYSEPKSLQDIVDFFVVRLFDQFDEDLRSINRWKAT